MQQSISLCLVETNNIVYLSLVISVAYPYLEKMKTTSTYYLPMHLQSFMGFPDCQPVSFVFILSTELYEKNHRFTTSE